MITLRARTGITQVTGEFMETRAVVRTRSCSGGAIESVPSLLDILHRERFTGKVVVEMSQGGVRSILAEDRQQIAS